MNTRHRLAVVAGAVAIAAALAGCGTPQAFTTGGIRDEVSKDLPEGWKVAHTEGRDAGNCLSICIGKATLTVSTPDASAQQLRDQLRTRLAARGWRREPIQAADAATRQRYPLGEMFEKQFDDRSGKSGSYELIPESVTSTSVRLAVSIDAHEI